MMTVDVNDLLEECTDLFGLASRRFSLWDRLGYLRIKKHKYLRRHPEDELNVHSRLASAVLRDGVVVWGHIIQANSFLFKPGKLDWPAELVYSLEDSHCSSPAMLRDLAHRLFALKGTTPSEPGAARIAAYLTAENQRVYGLPVPKQLSPHVRCRISTTIIARNHLPLRRLCSSLLPIVVNPVEPFVALPLPSRYWPDELIQFWIE